MCSTSVSQAPSNYTANVAAAVITGCNARQRRFAAKRALEMLQNLPDTGSGRLAHMSRYSHHLCLASCSISFQFWSKEILCFRLFLFLAKNQKNHLRSAYSCRH